MTWRNKAKLFLADMWTLALVHEGSITSGCRTPRRNRAKGGKDASKHKTVLGGLACDFVFHSKTSREAAKAEARRKGYFTYVGRDYGPHRLHVQCIQAGVDPRTVLTDIPTKEN